MRRFLGSLLLLAALTACGEESSAPVADAPEPLEPVLVSGSNGGGVVDTAATPLPDEAAVTAFATGLDDTLAAEVADAVAEVVVPEGQALYGAVVAIGCTPPEAVAVAGSGESVVVTARASKEEPEVQCLVPVTTVALVSAPA